MEKAFGPNHPYVATSINNLASVLAEEAKYEESETLYRRALSIYQKQLGKNNSLTVATQGNLDQLLNSKKKEKH
jgi:hypothetical protein